MSAHAAHAEREWAPPIGLTALRPGAGAWLAIAGGAALAAIAFEASGGLQLAPTTRVEVLLTIVCAAAIAGAIALSPVDARVNGMATTFLFAALAVLTAASVGWSFEPSASWVEASRTFAYAFVFTAALASARTLPRGWSSLLGAIIIGAVLVCGYALLTKVFPAALASDEPYARLRQPYGYWNAVGLTAALAVPPCLWLGARRSGHAALNALAFPALGILLVTLMFAYSRGALLALLLGCGFWFAAVPLRLRGAAVLGTAAAVTAAVVAWVFTTDPLTKNHVDLTLRSDAGYQLGILLLAMLVVLSAAGLLIAFRADRRPLAPPTRRTVGTAILVALALVPVSLVTALAFSPRGLEGSLAHDWRSLTDPHARTPPNDPSRLTAVGSVRARYWNEALKIFRDHPGVGVGAGAYGTARLRYRNDTLDVGHAHGYVVQTLADLGLLGLAVSLALAIAWLLAAARTAAPFGWRPPLLGRTAPFGWRPRFLGPRAHAGADVIVVDAPVAADAPLADVPVVAETAVVLAYTPERVGLLTLVACVVVFGVHSLIDWTWFVPGNACVALLCAGWLAGRGPFEQALAPPSVRPPVGRPGRLPRLPPVEPIRAAAGAFVLAVAVVLAWSQWQPLRSARAGDSALAALERHDLARARSQALAADNRNPLSVEPLFDLAAIGTTAGDLNAARQALERAVRRQPANPQTWLHLAELDLQRLGRPRLALSDLRPALYLDPRSYQVQAEVLAALRHPAASRGPAPRTATR